MNLLRLPPLLTGLIGVVTGIAGTYFLSPILSSTEWWPGHTEHNHSTEYHTHADFLVVVNDTIMDLSKPEYMSTAEKILAEDVHLHDGDGTVVHYHTENVTFAYFLASLGVTLTDTCLTIPNTETVCTGDQQEVALYVNGERFTDPLTAYIAEDLDQVLLYATNKETADPLKFLNLVGDRACIFSGSCPERGIAPAESCGLTCEL